ncbi:sterol desaturase family protein [Roseomonas fluvialis]|uniref:Fatty acid hydroxylase n=1 Tax=Roseomonas fluvialis TaxID=1750527 RepID=A0ABN6NZE0_9PROT|nr:sterol desaturase family protein [Roseomonas fluvialis]BDG71546.1 fatty acid hydroxylase [Roseomonas fluvialis]
MLDQEPIIRLSVFAAVLVAMAALEHAFPRRPQRLAWRRWPSNFGLVAVATVLLRLVAPAGAVGVALWAESRGLGLFPVLGVPWWVAAPAAVLLLDLLIYAQHRIFHAVPILWRLHRVHHADPELDASSGLRFHPVEILLSLAIKGLAVVALGAPPEAVLVFEVLLNATSLFNHANIAIPAWVDRPLRWVVVTPDMHRVHHSEIRAETDSDFGFCLSVWDRMFGTYVAEPAAGQLGMVIGVEGYREEAEQRIDRLLVQPLKG